MICMWESSIRESPGDPANQSPSCPVPVGIPPRRPLRQFARFSQPDLSPPAWPGQSLLTKRSDFRSAEGLVRGSPFRGEGPVREQIRPMIETVPLANAAEAYGQMMRNEARFNHAGHWAITTMRFGAGFGCGST